MNKQELKILTEKILEEKFPELKTSNQFFQDGKWVLGTPIWIRRVDKQDAKELKRLLETLQNKSRDEILLFS